MSSNLQRTFWSRLPVCLMSSTLVIGCSSGTPFAPAPNIYQSSGQHPFGEVPEAWQNAEVEIFYATDRIDDANEGEPATYGHGRSKSVVFGEVAVQIGTDLSRKEVVEASTSEDRPREIFLELNHTKEIARLPESNRALDLTPDDVFVVSDDHLDKMAKATERIHEALREKLAQTDVKEVFLYVHGYNNTFEYAAMRMATLWHYLGRQGVPLLYSWPAAYPGWFRGYNYDRESSEFTVFHLKQIVQILFDCPEVEKINIIAHSRGTDVTLNMLREIWISKRDEWLVLRAQGKPLNTKLGTVIIAAADIDMNVFQQRFSAEWLVMPMDTVIFYLSQGDRAIGLSR